MASHRSEFSNKVMESAATLPGSQNIEMIAYPFAIHDTLERGIKWLTLS
jgi:hypothetical protein